MARKKVKKARKAVKFKVITIKLTARQRKSLVNYSLMHHTTPNKLIKKAIRPMLEHYADAHPVVKKQEKLNQLQLF